MDREKIQTFIHSAAAELASVRSSLLIIAQTGDAADLTTARRNLARLNREAISLSLPAVAELCAECDSSLSMLSGSAQCKPSDVYPILDLVARIEAAVFKIPISSDESAEDISQFVDATFEGITEHKNSTTEIEEFEIDEETLEVFREEADELLANIGKNLETLLRSPADQNALWEIRRNAHTFKGAAGIVGLKDASVIAHRMEDLLDKLVEFRLEAAGPALDLLVSSADELRSITAAKDRNTSSSLDQLYKRAMDWIATPTGLEKNSQSSDQLPGHKIAEDRGDIVRTTTTPIVRVSLDRLDELIKLSRSLLFNRSALAERFDALSLNGNADKESLQKFESLIATQRELTDEIQAKILKIRMVRFGTLETRLSRAVNVTCIDEGKKAFIDLYNGEVEIDTLIIDALIEPLLHLLKNAVVHGIEPPDTRRLIGKPERGRISVRVEADEEALVLTVADDGAGISIPKLIEKAVAAGTIDDASAAQLSDRDALKLVFDRGLTTVDKLDMNAGRGIGMSIVKEGVESRGGSVLVESQPQIGTTFTILLPLIAKSETPAPQPEPDAIAELPPLVLIVDDSASVRRHTTKLVEGAGLRVITANNGAEALELLLNGEWEPDLILSDVEMPQIDGWEFLEYVKTDDNFGHIPVIMVTSLDGEDHCKRAFALGADDFVVKPFDIDDLERVVGKLAELAGV